MYQKKNIQKVRARCPRCKSTVIYKRMRIEDKKKRTTHRCKTETLLNEINNNFKTYICRDCNYEFDDPFIGYK